MVIDEFNNDPPIQRQGLNPFEADRMSMTDAVLDAPTADLTLLPAELLRGDETIIFAIKPSPWFVLFDASRWVVVGLMTIALASWISEIVPGATESQLMSVALMLVSVRIAVALLRWVSRFYVLTNRRVMTIRGVRRPNVFASLLVNIRNTAVHENLPEAITGLGTLEFALSEGENQRSRWRNVPQPDQVHAEVRKAIERAIDCQPHL